MVPRGCCWGELGCGGGLLGVRLAYQQSARLAPITVDPALFFCLGSDVRCQMTSRVTHGGGGLERGKLRGFFCESALPSLFHPPG